VSLAGLVGTLEALLIEALEPPQNRKRGDGLSAIEYVQHRDPELKEIEIQNTPRLVKPGDCRPAVEVDLNECFRNIRQLRQEMGW